MTTRDFGEMLDVHIRIARRGGYDSIPVDALEILRDLALEQDIAPASLDAHRFHTPKLSHLRPVTPREFDDLVNEGGR